MNPSGLYFEDWEAGRTWTTLPRTVTETDVVNFVGVSGLFERLFLDADYVVNESIYRKRLVPAMLTLSLAEGLVAILGLLHETGMAFLGMTMSTKTSVGVGDTLHVEVSVLEKRPTQKNDRGLVRWLHRVVNQHGECVMEYEPLRMVKRRSG